jgi:hypothetical protein
MIFRAGNPRSLADRVVDLLDDDALYRSLSENSVDAWRRLQVPVRWGELIRRWVRDQPADRDWLGAHSLR